MSKVNAKGIGLSVLAIETATHRTETYPATPAACWSEAKSPLQGGGVCASDFCQYNGNLLLF
jgi:hypothetical protein